MAGDRGSPLKIRDARRTSITPTRLPVNVFLVAFGLFSTLSGIWSIYTSGTRIPTTNGLLFRPDARFSDLADPLVAVASGNPFAPFVNAVGVVYPEGINYPPGSVAILKPLLELSPTTTQWALVAALVIGVTCIVRFVAFSAIPLHTSLVAPTAVVTAAIVYLNIAAYPLVVLVAGIATLAGVAVSIATRTTLWPLLLTVTFAAGFPAAISIDRMNVDIIVFCVSAIGVVLAYRAQPSWSAMILGIAIGLKIYPVVFLVALPTGTYRQWFTRLGVSALAAVAITVAGLAMIDQAPMDALVGFRAALRWVEETYAIGDAGMGYGASLFTGIKAIHYSFGGLHDGVFARALYTPWQILWLPVSLLVMIVGVVLRFPTWARLATAVAIILLASPITGSYRVLFLLIPIAFWIDHLIRQRVIVGKIDRFLHLAIAVAFAAMLVPKTFWTIGDSQITSETLISPAVLTIILGTAAVSGWRSRTAGDAATHRG